MLGLFDGQRLRLEEVYRFENGPVEVDGHLYWDLLGQWSARLPGPAGRGRRMSATRSPASASIPGASISACLGRSDELLGNPYHYRDSRTNGMMEKAFAIVGRDEIFRHTGLQFMQFNTLYQLLAMKLGGSPLLDVAETSADDARPVPLAADRREVQRDDRRQHDAVLQSGPRRLGDRAVRPVRAADANLGPIAAAGHEPGPAARQPWPPRPAWRPRWCCPARTTRPAP